MDDKNISKLYESIHKVDYFSVDEKDFNEYKFFGLEEGFANLCSLNIYEYILESFKQVKHNVQTTFGEEDVYEIVLHNGLLFTLHLDYIEPYRAKDTIHRKAINAEHKQQNTLAKQYYELYNEFERDEVTCVIMFKDERGKFEQTGEVGMTAKELFVTLKNAIEDSWSKRDFKKIKTILMRVNKTEPKRLEFYKMLLRKFLPAYKNIIVDSIAEDSNILLFASK
jgi:hypothetical protein